MAAVTNTLPPSGVNLIALLSRLYMTCLNFASSANSGGRFAAASNSRLMCFLLASVLTMVCTSDKALATLKVLRISSTSSGLHLGQIKNVVDELEQVASAVEDVVAVFELPLVQIAKSFVGEHFRKADDGIERRAQLVAHVGEELALGEIRGFGGVLGVLERPASAWRAA